MPRAPTWASILVATGALGHVACTTPSGGAAAIEATGGGATASPLTLTRAVLASPTELQLTFSEALRPLDGVDPTDFRLSRRSLTYRAICTYSYDCHGHYSVCPHVRDPCTSDFDCIFCSTFDWPKDHTEYYDITYITALAQGGGAAELVATLGAEVPMRDCGELFLHYAPGAVAIESTSGDPLTAVAPAWVTTTSDRIGVHGDLPDHPAPLLCGLACTDGRQDEGETDVDCGGPTACPRCGAGKQCERSSDCATAMNCIPDALVKTCQPFSCTDAVKDGDETDVDCGGSCLACVGASCVAEGDCASGLCVGGFCAPPFVVGLSAGTDFTCAVTSVGQAKCWGDNSQGQLGDGTSLRRKTPVDVIGIPTPVVSITAGFEQACAITADGALFCWGAEPLGSGAFRPTPVEVTSERGARAVALGRAGACVLTAAGAVDCWDVLTREPKPVGGLQSGVTAIAAGGDHLCAVTAVGAVVEWGPPHRPIIEGGLTSGVVNVVTGAALPDYALTTTGAVELSASTTLDGLGEGAVALAEGEDAACAVTRDGGLVCWGENYYGEVGDGTKTMRPGPVNVQGLTASVAQIAGVTVGDTHACALTVQGHVKCWGDNSAGQLGNGTTDDALTPVDVHGL